MIDDNNDHHAPLQEAINDDDYLLDDEIPCPHGHTGFCRECENHIERIEEQIREERYFGK